METTEKSLLPQMSKPVERKLFDAPVVGGNGAALVVASNPHWVPITDPNRAWCIRNGCWCPAPR